MDRRVDAPRGDHVGTLVVADHDLQLGRRPQLVAHIALQDVTGYHLVEIEEKRIDSVLVLVHDDVWKQPLRRAEWVRHVDLWNVSQRRRHLGTEDQSNFLAHGLLQEGGEAPSVDGYRAVQVAAVVFKYLVEPPTLKSWYAESVAPKFGVVVRSNRSPVSTPAESLMTFAPLATVA